eukprot:207219-Chlamydomonas_euryale.AAC.1
MGKVGSGRRADCTRSEMWKGTSHAYFCQGHHLCGRAGTTAGAWAIRLCGPSDAPACYVNLASLFPLACQAGPDSPVAP